MNATARIRGVIAAVATPVDAALEPDLRALIQHSRWLLSNGCDGLNILGTTGGFASFSVAQRHGIMRALADSDLPLAAMMVGTGASALPDTVALTQAAVELGFAGALVIPPFYYKGVFDDGVFAYLANLIERVGATGLRLYLYNFPAMSGVAYTPALVGRLLTAYPGVFAGLKDSSNDAEYTALLHREYPQFDLFPSSESVLDVARRTGYAGIISASANVTAPLCGRVWAGGDVDGLGHELAAMRDAITSVPLIPAVHHLLAQLHADDVWSRLNPPLHALDANQSAALEERLGRTTYRGAHELVTDGGR